MPRSKQMHTIPANSSLSPPTIDSSLRNEAIISQALNSGPDHPDATFLHGTSVRAVELALSTGSIPAGLKSDGFTADTIYFAPLPTRFTIPNPHCTLPRSDQDALSWAETYSRLVSRKVAVLELLNLDPNDRLNCSFAEQFSRLDYPEEFQVLNLPPSLTSTTFDHKRAHDLFRDIQRAENDMGVVLFFSKALQE